MSYFSKLSDASPDLRPIPALSLMGSMSPLLLVPMMMPVALAIFSSNKVIDDWSIAKKIVDVAHYFFPSLALEVYANSTMHSQPILLANSLALLVIPFCSIVWMVQSIVNYPRLLALANMRGGHDFKRFFLSSFIGIPMILGALYVFMTFPGDPSFAQGITTKSRVGF